MERVFSFYILIYKSEEKEKKEIAKRLLKAGVDIETIVIATELTKEEIISLQKDKS